MKLIQFFGCLAQLSQIRHVKSSDRSAAKKTDDGYQGQGCPCLN